MHVAITAKAASEQANIFLKVVVFKNFPLANFFASCSARSFSSSLCESVK